MSDIDRKLGQLQAMRGALKTLVESCACGAARPVCPILEALDEPEETAVTLATAGRKEHDERTH
jgi:hypothetical protein